MTPEQTEGWKAWLATWPKAVRELAEKYPPGTSFQVHARVMWAISYDEHADGTATLGITEIDPSDNYALAIAKKEQVCKCCMPKLAELVLP